MIVQAPILRATGQTYAASLCFFGHQQQFLDIVATFNFMTENANMVPESSWKGLSEFECVRTASNSAKLPFDDFEVL